MNENLVVRTTADFILRSAKNLDLALQVEEAMPQVRADQIGEFLNSVEAELSTDEWQGHKSGTILSKRNSWLGLCGRNWPAEREPADRTSIRLMTDKAVWADVFVGVYFSKMMRNGITEDGQGIIPAMRKASAELPSGHGWVPHEFSPEPGGWNGWATYRYLDEPLRDWSSAQFLRDSFDPDRRRELVQQVVDRINTLKPGACALVEAAARSV